MDRRVLVCAAAALVLGGSACGARTELEVPPDASHGRDAGPVVRLTDVLAIASAVDTTCALRDGGRVSCWGVRLGAPRGTFDLVPTELFSLPGARALGVGTAGCLLDDAGGVWCWGENCAGQLGTTGTGDLSGSTSLVRVEIIDDAVDLDVGMAHACVIRADGSVWCWGHGADGQLGDGTTTSTPVFAECETFFSIGYDARGRAEPRRVVGIEAAVDVSAGQRHSCAVTAAGEVWCWGAGGFGELGDGRATASAVPVRVVGIDDAVEVSAGWSKTCARRRSGALACWGRSYGGALGDGRDTDSPVPVAVARITDATAIDVGGDNSCAVAGGVAWSWGADGSGLGVPRDLTRPARIIGCELGACPFVPTARRVACGTNHGCLIELDGRVRCWGSQERGATGTGFHIGDAQEAWRVVGPLGGG